LTRVFLSVDQVSLAVKATQEQPGAAAAHLRAALAARMAKAGAPQEAEHCYRACCMDSPASGASRAVAQLQERHGWALIALTVDR
jgi:hypothetical protein